MAWEKIKIQRDNGEFVDAQAPVIISASRSTDIPAFYADWFFDRLEKGYSAWTNPFNGVASYVSYQNTRLIVFWSKNPKPLLKYLPILKNKNINCYIQFTMNDYEEEQLEKGVPSLTERIETFKKLVAELGIGRVIWRFDPLILTDKIDMDSLLQKIEYLGDQLEGYTEKLVFSFADIVSYRKVKANLERNHINYIDWSKEQMIEFAERLVHLNETKGWNYSLATCGEVTDLEGIEHNHCVDDRLIVRFGYKFKELMEFLGVDLIDRNNVAFPFYEDVAIPLENGSYAIINKNNKDKGQRTACGCMKSKDIGEYNTCPHLCEYCYANASKDIAIRNWQQHKESPNSETITGK